ncbi:TPA: AAA family ATPase, partial [Candidatus Micrarchaeota archaeon]|nr:AAA family ATPase [Candidatus Micrarchaeota archaeon]
MALPHLEEMARRYAIAAVNADRSGDVDKAITNYRKAIDVLAKIIKLYPDSPFTSIYLKMMREYEARLKELQSVALAA